MVVQTHGRSGQYNPHLHIIATSGGWDQEAHQWVHLDDLPYEMRRKKWQWHLLTMLRQTQRGRLRCNEADASLHARDDALTRQISSLEGKD